MRSLWQGVHELVSEAIRPTKSAHTGRGSLDGRKRKRPKCGVGRENASTSKVRYLSSA